MTERPLTFDEFLLLKQQQMASYAPGTQGTISQAPPPPAPPPPAPAPSESYGGPTPTPALPSSNAPNAIQISSPASGAEPYTAYTTPTPQPQALRGDYQIRGQEWSGGQNTYFGMTPDQANTVYQENVPSFVVPFAQATYADQQRKEQQANDPVRQAAITAEATRLQAATPGMSQAEATTQAEQSLQSQQSQQSAPDALGSSAIGSLTPVRGMGALVGALGAAKDALPTQGPIGAIGTGLSKAGEGLIKAAAIPSQRLDEVTITRKYDELTKNNPDATFGAYLPSTILESTVINPAEQLAEEAVKGSPRQYEAMQTWLDDPTNAGLIQSLFEQGYAGEQGYAAVKAYFDEQAGLGAIAHGIIRDPFTYAAGGVGAMKSTGARLAAQGGKIGTAGKVIGGVAEIADAAFLDPLKAPGLVVRGVDAAIPAARLGERLATGKTAVGNAVLTEAGRRGKTLNQAEESAANLVRAAEPTSIPSAWTLERDAAGNVVQLTSPTGHVRPVVRDLDTGVARVVEAGDVERAMQIASRLPNGPAYQQHMNDWLGLITSQRKALGLPEEISTLYPSRGAPYQRFAVMEAERIKRYGQEVIDASYERMNNLAQGKNGLAKDPVKAALLADRIQSSMEIAGVTDLNAAVRKKQISRIRTEARATGNYRKTSTYNARIASGAKTPPGGTPTRLTFSDTIDVLDDDTKTFGETVLADRRVVGDVVMDINQDAQRLQALAKQATTGTPLSAWDQSQLDQLLKKYGQSFPRAVSDIQNTMDTLAKWSDEQRQAFVSNEATRQIAIDKGWANAKTGALNPTGIAASKGPLGKLVRGLDSASAGYKKVQLYNPLNILRYSGLQAIGNAVTIAVGDLGALEDYAKAIGSRGKHLVQGLKEGGPKGITSRMEQMESPADAMMRGAGLGRSPFLKEGIKDDLSKADFGDGPVTSVLKAGRNFAGAFDISLREAAYMHRFQPKYRALQMSMADKAIETARRMGVPVSPDRIEQAVRGLDALGNPYRTWDAAQLKSALVDAAREPGMLGLRTNVENWADRVSRDYANGTRLLHKDAISNVNRLGFAFDEVKGEQALGRIFFYTQWTTRANMLYTREMLGNPALLNAYVNTWKTLDRQCEKDNCPSWQRGMIQFFQSPMGLTVLANPLAVANAMGIFNPDILAPDWDNSNLTDLGKARQRSPFMVNPFVDTLLLAVGAYGSGAQPSNLMPISFSKLYDWINEWNAHTDNPISVDEDGNPVPLPWPLRFGVVGQEVPKILAEKLSPLTAPLLNQMKVPADVMQFGDAAAGQRQDLTFLMLDVLAEQNPTLSQEQLNDLLVDEHAGGFDTGDPIYQQALDRYTERAYAGILEGKDVPNAVRALISATEPFQRSVNVTARTENDAAINGYFQSKEDAETYQNILAAQIDEPLRVGGFDVAPPSLFTEVHIGGSVVTPEDLAGMSDRERQEVADAWFTQRNPGVDPANIGTFPEAAYRASQIAKAADPKDLALQEAENRWSSAGTPEQNQLAHTVNGIKYNALPEGTTEVQVTIDGQVQTFDGADLEKMTEDERRDLASLWVAEQPGGQDALDGYYAAQQQLVTVDPDLGGWKAMQNLAKGYPGGGLAWVQEAVKENPSTYGQYAATLDPTRYPEGSPDWVKEMLSLEAYQSLNQERPSSRSPLAWEETPGAPVIPGLSGAASLPELYQQQQTADAEERSTFKNRGDYASEDMQRLSGVKSTADQWDIDHGVAPGTSWGQIMSQMTQGYQKGVNGVDYDLKELLDEQYPRTGPNGEVWSAIPGPTSSTGKYVIWALGQPPDQRDPQIWARQSLLKEEFGKAEELGISTDAAGNVTLNPEPAAAPAEDILAGYGMTRAVDGSGFSLSTQPVPSSAPAPSWKVGGLGGTLYADASTNSQSLLALRADTPLTTLGEQGDWVNVQHPSGLTGWVRKRFLATDTTQTAAPVSSTTTPSATAPSATPITSDPGATYTAGAGDVRSQIAAQQGQPLAAAPPSPPTSIPVLSGIGDALGAVGSGVMTLGGNVGTALGEMAGHGLTSGQPPKKPGVGSRVKAALAAPTITAPEAAPNAAPAHPPVVDPLAPKVGQAVLYDVADANDGIGVQSTEAGSDRTWMEDMIGKGHAQVNTEYKGPEPSTCQGCYGYQDGHGAATNNHAAYDIGCDNPDPSQCPGTPIYAPLKGVVACAGYGNGTSAMPGETCYYSANMTNPNNDGSPAAHTVTIVVGQDVNGNDIELSLNHMGTSNLQPGQQINAGDLIGGMGNTDGGPHVHLQSNAYCPALGTYVIVDPQLVVGGYYKSHPVC